MPQWTKDQQRVIGSSSRRLICSAAAGSGKTTVMIERIVRLIREGADPFSFLVITFTNAAAAEMKEKIRKRLLSERKDPVIASAAEKAGVMEICTIHAFCQHLIRQEFQLAGVDPVFRICTGAQREQLFTEAFRQACNSLREKEDPDYLAFIRQYEPKAAREIVTSVWQFIMSLPDPFGWLREKTENVPVEIDRNHPWFQTVSRMVGEKILSLRVILRQQAEMFDEYEKVEAYRPVFKEDQAIVDAICRWRNEEEVSSEELKKDFVRIPSVKNLNDLEIAWKERYQNLRKELKDTCTALKAWIFPNEDRMKKEFSGIRDTLRGLAKITEETHIAYENNKARVCSLDFSDLEHKALEILKTESGRAAVRNRWQRIFVDECQDISSVQDALIQALAGDNSSLFMVGDVKQSIYRFRLANPKLFLSRITDRGPDADECIFLQENYRSRPEVLETANTIFRDVMRKEAADLEYAPEDELRLGRTDCTGQEPVMVDLIEPREDQTGLEAVADHTAQQILEMVADKKYRFRDMVILMPEVSTDGPKLTEMLKSRGIPVFFDGKGSFFEQQEVEVFRNLLMLLDNPHQDLPLLTVLVNPPFDFSEEELSAIRLLNCGRNVPFWQAFEAAAEMDTLIGHKVRKVIKRLEEWRFQAKRIQLPVFLWYLVEDSDLCAIFGATDHGLSAQKNLRSFCLQAEKAAERNICTLREFLGFLSEQAAGGELQAASALGNEDDLVRIMTMHKSKGLQFPVVFCLGLEKGLKGKPGSAVQLDEELGVCLRYKVPEYRLSRKTAADEIFEWKKNHDVKAEKICLLYVAVTRAQEKLFLVGSVQDRPLWHMPSGDHRTLAAADYLDLIMPSLMDDNKKSTTFTQASKPWKIRILDSIQQENVENPEVFHSLLPWVETLLSAPPVDEMWKTDQEKKEARAAENQLKKYSVTSVLRKARNRIFMEDTEQTPEEKRIPEYVEKFLSRYRTGIRADVTAAMPEADGAARGTVIHRFLCLADLDAVRREGGSDPEKLKALVDNLVKEQVFTPEEGGWIRPEAISRFYTSDIGRRMLASQEIHREWDFNLYVQERGMIVQGMIDCAFLEGDGWILLDYKTDRIRDEKAFMDEYRPQLEWYALALKQLTGKPVLESWLYALSVDKAFMLSKA